MQVLSKLVEVNVWFSLGRGWRRKVKGSHLIRWEVHRNSWKIILKDLPSFVPFVLLWWWWGRETYFCVVVRSLGGGEVSLFFVPLLVSFVCSWKSSSLILLCGLGIVCLFFWVPLSFLFYKYWSDRGDRFYFFTSRPPFRCRRRDVWI